MNEDSQRNVDASHSSRAGDKARTGRRRRWPRLVLGSLAVIAILGVSGCWLVERPARSMAQDAILSFTRELPAGVTFSYAQVETDLLRQRMTLRGVALRDERGPEALTLRIEAIRLDQAERSRGYLDASRLLLSGLRLESEDGQLAANLQSLDVHDIHLPLPQVLPPGEVIQGLARQSRFELAEAEGFTLRREGGEQTLRGRVAALRLTGFTEGRLAEIAVAGLQLERAGLDSESDEQVEQVAFGELVAVETDLASLFLEERTAGLLRAAPTALDIRGFSASHLGLPSLTSNSVELTREGGDGGAAMAFSAAWDTIDIPMEYLGSPELRRLLLAMGYRSLRLDGKIAYRFEERDHGLVLAPLELSIGEVAQINGRLSLDSLPPSVPGLLHLAEGGWKALRLREAEFSYRDDSLADRLIALGASESGMEEPVFRNLILSEIDVIGRFGSGDPLQRETLEALHSFLTVPQGLRLTAQPESPVALGEIFAPPVLTGPALPRLNPAVTTESLPVGERQQAEIR